MSRSRSQPPAKGTPQAVLDEPLAPEAVALARVAAIMAQLRGPQGCPWDRAQTFATIAPYTIEEAHEVADAIHRRDMPGLKDELGDLLLQVLFHARMAEEVGAFGLTEVIDALADKLVRRHPHVFAALDDADASEVARQWDEIKRSERGPTSSVLDGIAPGLPALMRAQKLGRRAAHLGFDWTGPEGARAKLLEEMTELDAATSEADRHEEAGDLLLAAASWLRHLGIDAEEALAAANAKFERRFRAIEQTPDFANISPDEQDRRWRAGKES